MINSFQKALIQHEHDDFIWDIVVLFHPDLVDKRDKQFKRLKLGLTYNWVTIDGYVNSDVRISIGLEYDPGLSGMQSMDSFNKAYGKKQFKAWQFWNARPQLENSHKNVSDLAIKHNVPYPTAAEMYNYYYED